MPYLKADLISPIEFISGGFFVSDVSWTHSRRTIDSFELIVGVRETLYMEQDGIRYEVKPGDALLLLPGHFHGGYAPCSENISFNWVHFQCAGAFELLDDRTAQEQLRSLKPAGNAASSGEGEAVYIPLFSSPPSVERIRILFHQMLHTAKSHPYTMRGAHHLLTALLIEITEQTLTRLHATGESNAGEENLAKIIEWIRIHSAQDISVSAIADAFGYNKTYLSHLFRKKTGVSLKEWIHRQQLSRAKDLLSRTSLGIKEIAHSIGIGDEKYFMKLFKKYEGLTPTEFRKAYFRTHMNSR